MRERTSGQAGSGSSCDEGDLVRGAGSYDIADLIENDSGSVLLLQMLHPERAPLVWKRR